jgi:hypothetical protein
MFLYSFLLAAKNDDDYVSSSNATLCDNGACADVQGHSGKITFTFEDTKIQVTMDSINEVDASGDDTDHGFNSFASQDFFFSEEYSMTFKGIAATAVNFSAVLMEGTSNFTCQLIMFVEDGFYSYGNVTYRVTAGTFKFGYDFSYWPFCTIGGTGVTECTHGNQEQEGAYLDLTISLKNDDENAVTNGTTVEYPGSAYLYQPDSYELTGGVFESMPPGYPMTTLQGSKTILTYRFYRFDQSLYYDPVLSWEAMASDDDNDDNAASMKQNWLPWTVTMFSALFALFNQM